MGFPAGPDTPAHTMINPSTNTEDLVYLMVGDRPKPGVRSHHRSLRLLCQHDIVLAHKSPRGTAQDTDIVDYPNVNVRMFRWVTRDGTEGRQSVPVSPRSLLCCAAGRLCLAACFCAQIDAPDARPSPKL